MGFQSVVDVIYQLDDATASASNHTNITGAVTTKVITPFVLTGGDIGRERMIEENHPQGQAYPEQVDTGAYGGVSFTIGGFLKDDSGELAEQLKEWFTSTGKILPRWFRKNYGNGKYTLFKALITGFNRTGESKQNQRFEATMISSGTIHEDAVP